MVVVRGLMGLSEGPVLPIAQATSLPNLHLKDAVLTQALCKAL